MGSIKWKIAQTLELQWWKNYLAKKNPSAYNSWKSNYWLNFIKNAEPYFELESMQHSLDAGCGPAGINMILPNEVVAIDPLMDNYRELQHFVENKNPRAVYFQDSIETFSPTKKFDLVCCLNVINHVKDIKTSMHHIFEWTKPGGWLLLSIDAHNYAVLKYLFRIIPGDVLHPYQMDLNEYKQLVEDVGYKLKGQELIKVERIFNYYLLIAQKPL